MPVAALLAIAVPAILWGGDHGRGYSDQVNYHQRVIERFASELPSPGIRDYAGVMTPLYHLGQAVVLRVVGGAGAVAADHVTLLRLVGAVFGPLMLGVMWVAVGKWTRPAWTALLLMPLALSPYIVDSTVWILPDNMAWTMVAGILALCFARSSGGPRKLAIMGALLAVLVATRQSNIWLAAVVWAWAFVGDDRADRSMLAALRGWRSRARPTLAAIAATLPAFALLGYFYVTWGGRLQPPMWDEWYARKWNFSGIPFVLALVGLFSVFYVGFLLPTAWRLIRWRPRALLIWGLLAAAVSAIPRSDYDMSQGRYGAIWSIADRFPCPMGRSLLLIALAGAGGMALVCWAAALGFRRRWILLAALAAFGATQIKNPWLYQRYAEPLLLMLMTLSAAAIQGTLGRSAWHGGEGRRAEGPGDGEDTGSEVPLAGLLRVGGVAALALILAALTVQNLRGGGEVKVMAPGEIGHPPSTRR